MSQTALADRADLGALFDDHVRHEFVHLDVDATMATMAAEPYVNNVPVLTGGVGREGVRRFYAEHFIGQWPADIALTPVSRTVGADRVVDEMVLGFTHDVPMDWLLPGVPPTCRRVEVPVVVVMAFEGGKVAHEHIYWDQASVLVQVGLLDPRGLPVTGAEQARKLLDPSVQPNTQPRAGTAAAEPQPDGAGLPDERAPCGAHLGGGDDLPDAGGYHPFTLPSRPHRPRGRLG